MRETVWHALSEDSSISEKALSFLADFGYLYFEDLLSVSLDSLELQVASLDDNNVSIEILVKVLSKALLYRIDGLSEQHVNKLVDLQYNYHRIAQADKNDIKKRLDEFSESEFSQVASIQLSAANFRYLDFVTVVVNDERGEPINGAEISIIDPGATGDLVAVTFQTDKRGRALLEGVAYKRRHHLLAKKSNKYKEVFFDFTGRTEIHLVLNKASKLDFTHDESSDGVVPVAQPAIRRMEEFENWEDGTLLELTGLDDDQARLTEFYRKRQALNWILISSMVPIEKLPELPKVGNVYQLNSGRLVLNQESAEEFRMALLREQSQ